MSCRYGFVVEFIPESGDCNLLAGRCIKTLHGFLNANKNAANSIGVAFPLWGIQSVGKAIAFVGPSEKELVGLSYQPYFSMMKEEGLFNMSSVKKLPKQLAEVRFVRNQTIAKTFVASKRRRMNRAIERSGSDSYTPKASEEREFDFFHCIPIESKCSQQEFVLHVQKQDALEVNVAGFNSYGLATNQRWQGSVPNIDLTLFS
ncbi:MULTISPECIES: type I-F CRISPR-associated endoribonuclease Cas6/Csy4 [Echinimonadaceae]|uniref:Type I-F CRISPR-associated endoribonuclease Cas6/Csy4 n=2 Tax=Echinimonadaceae TaxID=3046600 RepID=A0A8J6QTY9_9GAMM|nr:MULTISPECIES: type I-F CRISPR-associated endoribonuclease Cas6/Csy4 [Echinimonadaceae]MBD1388393.1 type I-F CRISPR-associated endoribonuclease Cas6/Csy4 [Neiella litorisoli]MCM2679795.1 type I-F CRISPR-associated endoribonuclease Cas6/Csy4 [Echinimonas agarilytica]